jgi:hypothetical protein
MEPCVNDHKVLNRRSKRLLNFNINVHATPDLIRTSVLTHEAYEYDHHYTAPPQLPMVADTQCIAFSHELIIYCYLQGPRALNCATEFHNVAASNAPSRVYVHDLQL